MKDSYIRDGQYRRKFVIVLATGFVGSVIYKLKFLIRVVDYYILCVYEDAKT
jgi:hypothetical protein